MACDGYSCSALMGNWWEHKQSFKQPTKIKPEAKIVRADNDIKFISDSNQVKNLSKIARKPKWNTSAVVLDYDYREFVPESKEAFRKKLNDNFINNKDLRPLKKSASVKPKSERAHENMQTSGTNNYKMLDMKRNKHQQLKKRDYTQNVTDFYSTLKTHDKDFRRFFGMSTYQADFSRKRQEKSFKTKSRAISQSARGARSRPAGFKPNDRNLKGKRLNTFIVGEKYRDYEDPKLNTHCQRSWVYGKEKAMDTAERNLESSLAKVGGNARADQIMANFRKTAFPRFKRGDNINSLPLENGENDFFPRLNHNGAYRKIGSDVTKIRNKPWGSK